VRFLRGQWAGLLLRSPARKDDAGSAVSGQVPWPPDAISRVRAIAPGYADADYCAVLSKLEQLDYVKHPVAYAVSDTYRNSLIRELDDVLGKRLKDEARRANDERRTGPECEHGVAGGLFPMPGNGLPYCPNCRAEGKQAVKDPVPAPAGENMRAVVSVHESEDGQDEEVCLPAAPDFPHDKAYGPLRDLLDWADYDGLPVSYVAAAGEVAGAGAAAYGPGAILRLTGARTVRPSLWLVLIGESGDGKTPSITRAIMPVAHHYERQLADWRKRCQEDGTTHPRPQALMQSSISNEAMVRWLAANDGAGILRNSELGSMLSGLGQYKRGGGSDRFDLMDIWSGEPISMERVGQGGKKNAVILYVARPRLSIIGGLVPENLKLLGSESDGLRARFLPVLPSSAVIPRMNGGEDIPESFDDAIKRLYEHQEPREWTLSPEAHDLIVTAEKRWRERRISGAEPVTVKTALAKADEQCLRMALTVSELAEPGKGGQITAEAAVYAIARVDYSLDCWLTLGSDHTMAFSRKSEVINAAVADLLRRIERRPAGPDGRRFMCRRDIQRSQVGGATTSYLVDELIRAYLRAYPGSVIVCTENDLAKFPAARLVDREEMPDGGRRGPAPVVIYAPRRGR
jgi:hypothetical protein